MESQLSATARQQLNRFNRQYLQLQLDLDYPDDDYLRNDDFQQCLHFRLFSENGVKNAPPARYQLRVLKELTRRVEQSIQDWEEEVSYFLHAGSPTWHMWVVFPSFSDFVLSFRAFLTTL